MKPAWALPSFARAWLRRELDGLTNGLGNRKRVALRAQFEERGNERT